MANSEWRAANRKKNASKRYYYSLFALASVSVGDRTRRRIVTRVCLGRLFKWGMVADVTGRARSASTIRGTRSVQPLALRLNTRTRSPSRLNAQREPAGTVRTSVGRQGSMKPGG